MAISEIRRIALAAIFAVGVGLVATEALAQATAVSVSGTSYTQNFDGMTSSASAALPGGWSFFRSGTSATPLTYSSGSNSTTVTTLYTSGTPTNGGAYLWAPTTSGTDKSIGYLTASTSYPGPTNTSVGSQLAILFGFTNTTGATITTLDLGWNYERYREGSRTQTFQFYSSADGSTWTSGTLGDQIYTGTSTTQMYVPPQQISKALSIPSLSIASGSSYYFRWSWVTTGSWSNAQGVGLDDFTMNLTLDGPVNTDLYWDGNTGCTATAPGAGGTGTWADGTGSWDPSKKANFGGTVGTVTAAVVTASNGLVFATTGYTLTGGTITLAGASSGVNAITTGSTTPFTTTINTVISGTAGMTKAGPGTLVLGGTNTFTGGLAVNAGTLEIAADSALGDAANDLSLAGTTLKTTASVALGAGRDVTGSGTLDIAPGTTLTSSGSFNLTSTTLSNSGTLDLQGATRSVGALTFGTAATVNGSGAISASGLTATAVTSGSAIINPAFTFTSNGNKTVDVGSGGTLVLGGDVAGTTGRIAKQGAGTLIVNGSNATAGYQLGVSGTAPTNGGTLILGSSAASGTGQLQFNYGTLQASGSFTFANGLSVGGRSGAVAVLGGTNAMTFSGSTNFFRGAGTSGELRLDVNNATALAGPIGATSGTSGGASSTGITIGGTGSLAINGNASALVDTITIQDSLDLLVGGTLGSGVAAQAGTLLGGAGTISGAVTMANNSILAPGTSPGTLTIGNALLLNNATILNFELSASDQTVGGGVNDLVTGITNLTLDGVLNVSPIGDFSTVAAGTKWRLFDYSGTLSDLALTLGSMPTLASGNSFVIDTSTTGQVNLQVVPEPSSIAIVSLGIAAAGYAWRRRRTGRA